MSYLLTKAGTSSQTTPIVNLYPDLYKAYGVGASLSVNGMEIPFTEPNRTGYQIQSTFVFVEFVPNLRKNLYLWWTPLPADWTTGVMQQKYPILQCHFYVSMRDYFFYNRMWTGPNQMEMANPFYPAYWSYLANVTAPYLSEVSLPLSTMTAEWFKGWKDHGFVHRLNVFVRFEITCQVKRVRGDKVGEKMEKSEIEQQTFDIWISLSRVSTALKKDVKIDDNVWSNFTTLLCEAFQKSYIINSSDTYVGANNSDWFNVESLIRYYWTTNKIGITFFFYDPTFQYRQIRDNEEMDWVGMRAMDGNNEGHTYIWELWNVESVADFFTPPFLKPLYLDLDERSTETMARVIEYFSQNQRMSDGACAENYPVLYSKFVHENIIMTNGELNFEETNFFEDAAEFGDKYSKRFKTWLNSQRKRYEADDTMHDFRVFLLETVWTGTSSSLCEFLDEFYNNLLVKFPNEEDDEFRIKLYKYIMAYDLKRGADTIFHGHFIIGHHFWQTNALAWENYHKKQLSVWRHYPNPSDYGYQTIATLQFHLIAREGGPAGPCADMLDYFKTRTQAMLAD